MTQGRRPPPGPPIPPRPVAPARPGRAPDPVVAAYKDRVADRAKAAGEADRIPIPDLASATRDYRPGKDGLMTLGQIGEAQGNIRKMGEHEERKSTLSAGTLAGLQAVHDATVKAQGHATDGIAEAAAPIATPAAKEKTEAARRVDDMPDLDFDLALQRMRSDVINNDKERDAVRARVQPMELSDGLVTGEFKQTVPVVPDKLTVVFRTLTPMENEEIRKVILTLALEDERFADVQAEKYGFMQVVASISQVNGQEMPNHIVIQKGFKTFDWDTFNKKMAVFSGYPAPFIAALSTHANWFDMRVRELFATTNLKNG